MLLTPYANNVTIAQGETGLSASKYHLTGTAVTAFHFQWK